MVKIAGGFKHIRIHQHFHHGGAKALNVHGIPAGKVGQVAKKLRRALCTGTANVRAVLIPSHRGAAHGAKTGEEIRFGSGRALLFDHGNDLRDDLACLLHHHGVTHTNVLFGDEILVVKGCVCHCGARQTDGANHGFGCENAGAANLHHDLLHHAFLLLGGIFVCRSPPGEFRGFSKNSAICQVIQLYNCSVNIKGIALPIIPQFKDQLGNGFDLFCHSIVNHFEFKAPQPVQTLAVRFELHTFRILHIKNHNVQPTGSSDFGIQLAHGTRRGVAGVGKECLPPDLPLRVEPLKGLAGHIHLAAHDKAGRCIVQPHRNGSDGTEVLCHVLAGLPVSPGGAADKNSVFILQSDGKSVHLGLHKPCCPFGAVTHLAVEISQFFRGEHILKALKGNTVTHLAEAVQCLSAHPLGGGIRSDRFGVSSLQLLQTAQHPIILKIGNAGIVQHIISVVVFVQLPAKLFDLHQFIHVPLLRFPRINRFRAHRRR